jgi:hypothetical protein
MIPFAEFIAAARRASLSDLRRAPDCRVRDAVEFAEMRAFLLERYQDVVVARSLLVGGQTFDCVAGPDATVRAPVRGTECPPGTIPMRRITLEEMVRFATLRDFLGKSPGG